MRTVRSKFWMVLVLAVLLAIASSDAFADREHEQYIDELFADKIFMGHATCSAFNGLVAGKMEGVVRELIQQEASRHYDKLVESLGSEKSAELVGKIMEMIKDAYNSGEMVWSSLTSFGEACSEH
jgi:hypothetical protein